MPFLIAAGASLIPAGLKYIKSREQKKQADRLRQMDSTPEGVRENRTMARLAQSSGRMPGQDVDERRIEQSTASAVEAARMGATGAGGVLASMARGNGQRLNAYANLGTRTSLYHDRANANLATANNVQARYDEQGRAEFNNAKTSLLQASDANEMGALQDVANTGAFVAGELGPGASKTTADVGTVDPTVLTPQQLNMYRRRVNRSPAAPYGRGSAYGYYG